MNIAVVSTGDIRLPTSASGWIVIFALFKSLAGYGLDIRFGVLSRGNWL